METLATIIYYTCWRQVDRFQYLFQQPEQNPYKKETLWKPHCVTQIGCWYSAWCCWCCTFFTTRTQEESKQYVPFQPTTLREKDWRQHLCSKSIVSIAKPPDTHLFQQLIIMSFPSKTHRIYNHIIRPTYLLCTVIFYLHPTFGIFYLQISSAAILLPAKIHFDKSPTFIF